MLLQNEEVEPADQHMTPEDDETQPPESPQQVGNTTQETIYLISLVTCVRLVSFVVKS